MNCSITDQQNKTSLISKISKFRIKILKILYLHTEIKIYYSTILIYDSYFLILFSTGVQ